MSKPFYIIRISDPQGRTWTARKNNAKEAFRVAREAKASGMQVDLTWYKRKAEAHPCA